MGSLNNGHKIQQTSTATKHTGHNIEISNQSRDSLVSNAPLSNDTIHHYKWLNPTNLNVDLGFLDDTINGVQGVTFSPDGDLIALCEFNNSTRRSPRVFKTHEASGILQYDSVNDIYFLEEVDIPASDDSNFSSLNSARWSPDSQYLAVGNYSPDGLGRPVEVWKRSNFTFTKLPALPNLPVNNISFGDGGSVAWSPNGNYLAVGSTDNTAFLTVYRRIGDSFYKLPNPSVQPARGPYSIVWSPDGRYLACAGGSGNAENHLTIYEFADEIFTKISVDLPDDNIAGGSAWHVSWSPDGELINFICDFGGTGRLYIIKRNGTSFALLQTIDTAEYAYSSAYSPNGIYLLVAGYNDLLTLYERRGDHINKLEVIQAGSAGASWSDISWSSKGRRIAVGLGGGGLGLKRLFILETSGNLRYEEQMRSAQ